MVGPRRNMLEIEKVLENIVSRLQEQGVVSQDVDPRELAEKTLEHLNTALGPANIPKGNALRDPLVLMKLTLSIVATDKNPTNAPQLINKAFDLRTPEQLVEFSKEMRLDPILLKFMRLSLGTKKENLPPEDPERNVCLGLYDTCGNLIDRYEGVFSVGTLKGDKIQTIEELSVLTGAPAESLRQAEHLKETIEDDVARLANTPALKPH